MKNLALYIILFNPCDIVFKNIEVATKLGLKVFVFNNTCESEKLEKISDCGVEVFGNGNNVGLGMSLNLGLKKIFHKGFKACIYFDQDTAFSERALKEIIYIFNNNFNKNCLSYFFSSTPMNKLEFITINSGSLFNLEILNKLGYHSDSYFLEGIDYEMGLRAMQHNFSIQKYHIKDIDHQTFQDKTYLNFFGTKKEIRVYNFKRSKEIFIVNCRLFLHSIKIRAGIGYPFFFLKNILSLILRNPINYLLLKLFK